MPHEAIALRPDPRHLAESRIAGLQRTDPGHYLADRDAGLAEARAQRFLDIRSSPQSALDRVGRPGARAEPVPGCFVADRGGGRYVERLAMPVAGSLRRIDDPRHD